jgi:hypothetical protein
MKRFACIVLVFAAAGCDQGLNTPTRDASRSESGAPRRGPSLIDAGIAPDVSPVPDTIIRVDAGVVPDTVIAPEVQSLDSVPQADLQPIGTDAQTLPDGMAYPHDIAPNDAIPCMQQVIANGYASDKASCATLAAQGMKATGDWIVVNACVAFIDCLAANAPACASWESGDCFCLADNHLRPGPQEFYDGSYHGPGYQPLIDLIAPYCPTFFPNS